MTSRSAPSPIDAPPAPEAAPPAPDTSPVAPVEAHQRATGCPAWLHAATARRLRWGIGREISLNEYVTATAATAAHPCGG